MKIKKKFLFFTYFKEINLYDAYNAIINMNYYVCPRNIGIDELKNTIIDISESELIKIKQYVETIEKEIREFAYNECVTFNYYHKELPQKIKEKYPWLSKESIIRLISQGTYAAK